jgi:hypothetical protein
MKSFTPTLFVLLLGVAGCAKGGCVERIAHGPWEAIGQEPPKKVAVEEKFKEGGLPALLVTFGQPKVQTRKQLVWVFEARSISKRQRCSPDVQESIYDQSFTIVKVELRPEAHECRYEVRELLSDNVYKVTDIALIPRTSLGLKETSCGTRKM